MPAGLYDGIALAGEANTQNVSGFRFDLDVEEHKNDHNYFKTLRRAENACNQNL